MLSVCPHSWERYWATLENDIGQLVQSHVDLHQLSQENNHCVLTTEPDSDPSSFPCTRSSNSVLYRQFQPSWLKQYPWLHYSQHDESVYCRACALFAPKQVGGQDLGKFVTKLFKSLMKDIEEGIFSWHETSHLHGENDQVLGSIWESFSIHQRDHGYWVAETHGDKSEGARVPSIVVRKLRPSSLWPPWWQNQLDRRR